MADNKIQVLYIKGGMTFKDQGDYLDYLQGRSISLEARNSWGGGIFKDRAWG